MEKTPEKMLKEMIENYNSLTENEQDYYKLFGSFSDRQLLENLSDLSEGRYRSIEEFYEGHGSYVIWWHERTLMGQHFEEVKIKGKWAYKNLEKVYKTVTLANDRKKWGELRNFSLYKDATRRGDMTEIICGMFLQGFGDEDRNAFDAYINDPVFSTGQIVEFRSSMGVDSVVKSREYAQGSIYWYGVGNRELAKAKEKTYMIIETDPKIEGKIYSKIYSYKAKQGGSRFYKVLPMGEAKTYYVVEKFLKKCRKKAVKDANR